jgi:hypothetical protein
MDDRRDHLVAGRHGLVSIHPESTKCCAGELRQLAAQSLELGLQLPNPLLGGVRLGVGSQSSGSFLRDRLELDAVVAVAGIAKLDVSTVETLSAVERLEVPDLE